MSESDYYEGTVDPENGADWNQSTPVDTKPTLADFKKTVADYLAWEVQNIIKNNADSLDGNATETNENGEKRLGK